MIKTSVHKNSSHNTKVLSVINRQSFQSIVDIKTPLFFLRSRDGCCQVSFERPLFPLLHFRVCSDHVSSRLGHLPKDVNTYIVNMFNNHVPPPTTVTLVKEHYNTTLTEGDLYT